MNVKEYIKEISIVILGILIAFWISNIGMYYDERKTEKQVLSTILNEVQENSKHIEITLKNLDTLQATFNEIQNMSGESKTIGIKYKALNVKNVGYETAKYAGVLKSVDYNLVSKIVENYESQNSLKELEDLMCNELFLLLKTKIKDAENVDYLLLHISNLKNNLESLISDQKLLIYDLKKTLDIKD